MFFAYGMKKDRQNMHQRLYSHKTFCEDLGKIDCVITAPHCTYNEHVELLSTELNVNMSWQCPVNDMSTHQFTCQQELIELLLTEQHVNMSWQNLANDMSTNRACETILMWNQWKLGKWPKTAILDLFWGPNVGPLRPILYTSLKVAPMSKQSKIDMNPKETF